MIEISCLLRVALLAPRGKLKLLYKIAILYKDASLDRAICFLFQKLQKFHGAFAQISHSVITLSFVIDQISWYHRFDPYK